MTNDDGGASVPAGRARPHLPFAVLQRPGSRGRSPHPPTSPPPRDAFSIKTVAETVVGNSAKFHQIAWLLSAPLRESLWDSSSFELEQTLAEQRREAHHFDDGCCVFILFV